MEFEICKSYAVHMLIFILVLYCVEQFVMIGS
jgi:hypothetical protein